MTFGVAHWVTRDDRFCILVCKGKMFLSLLSLASVMCLHFSTREEYIFSAYQCQVLFLYTFSQLEDHCTT